MQRKQAGRGALYLALDRYREVLLLIIIAGLVGIVGIRNPVFLAPGNLMDIVNDTSILAILAGGMMCVLLLGSIDISVAANLALSGMAVGLVMRNHLSIVDATATAAKIATSTALPLLLVLGIGVGLVVGILNGLLIAHGRVLPIIATLGIQYIARAVTYLISGGNWVRAHQMSDALMALTRTPILGVNSLIWIAALVYLLLALWITYSRSGRSLYAVGSNEEAAQVRGIPVARAKITAHAIMGALAGLAGILWISRYGSAAHDTANGYELSVIASCVLGGVSVSGGYGRLLGVLLGALLIGVINNALPMLKISSFWKQAIQGLMILAAILSNVALRRLAAKQTLKRREI
ncbi:branched-chain amino acid ABC transporter permease [Clostridia bacterium]|nr:branched-chain amino acid ABC transporter permease [Clostridia bacterium]